MIELICVAKRTPKARIHWRKALKFLSDIGSSKAGRQDITVAVAVAAAERTE